MKPNSQSPTLGERFQIGASLIPPFAIAWVASRNGWIPVAPAYCLAAMPLALGLGMTLPAVFAPWHRFFSKARSKAGRAILAMLLFAVFFIVVTPLALVLRLGGKRFIDTKNKGSSWTPSRPYGSLRDQF